MVTASGGNKSFGSVGFRNFERFLFVQGRKTQLLDEFWLNSHKASFIKDIVKIFGQNLTLKWHQIIIISGEGAVQK